MSPGRSGRTEDACGCATYQGAGRGLAGAAKWERLEGGTSGLRRAQARWKASLDGALLSVAARGTQRLC